MAITREKPDFPAARTSTPQLLVDRPGVRLALQIWTKVKAERRCSTVHLCADRRQTGT